MTALIPDYASVFASMLLPRTEPCSKAKLRLGSSFVCFPLTPLPQSAGSRHCAQIRTVVCTWLKDAVAQADVELYVGVAMLDNFWPVKVIMKLAIDSAASQRLQQEASIYKQLGRVSGIPLFYGLYKVGAYTAMILSHVGRPIGNFLQLQPSQR